MADTERLTDGAKVRVVADLIDYLGKPGFEGALAIAGLTCAPTEDLRSIAARLEREDLPGSGAKVADATAAAAPRVETHAELCRCPGRPRCKPHGSTFRWRPESCDLHGHETFEYEVVPESIATATLGMKYDPATGDVSCQDPICPREHDSQERHVERRHKPISVPVHEAAELARPSNFYLEAAKAAIIDAAKKAGAFDERAETGIDEPNGTPVDPPFALVSVGYIDARRLLRPKGRITAASSSVNDQEPLYVKRPL